MLFAAKVFGGGILLVLFESVFLDAIDIAGIRPDLLVLTIVIMSGRTSFGKLLLLAFLLGLARDFLSVGAVGMNAFAFTMTAFLILVAEEFVLIENWIGQLVVAFAGMVIYGILILLLKPVLQHEIGAFLSAGRLLIGNSFYTAVLAPFLFLLLKRSQTLPYLRLKLKHKTEHESISEIET